MPEQSLHNQLKEWYRKPGDLIEGEVWGYKADIIRGSELIEIQTGNFQVIRNKLRRLLNAYPVRLIYPISERKWLIRHEDNKVTRRKSQHVGRIEEVFNELVYCPTIPLEKDFTLEVLLIHSEEEQEIKWRGKTRTKYRTIDRKLIKVIKTMVFRDTTDYLSLLPEMHGAFTARQLSKASGLRITLARKMVYCLAKMGLIEEVGSVARAKLYRVRAETSSSTSCGG